MNSQLIQYLTICRLIHHLNSQPDHHPVNSQLIQYLTICRLIHHLNSQLDHHPLNSQLILYLRNRRLSPHPMNGQLVRYLTNCCLIQLLTFRCMFQKNGYLCRVKETNGFESLIGNLPHARVHHLTLAVTYPNCHCWFLLAI